MLDIINASFRNMLGGFMGLAAGCMILLIVNRTLARRKPPVFGSRPKRLAAAAAAALAGVLLPFGPFGVVPLLMAGGYAGLDLFILMPGFVSNLLFNMSAPLADAGFDWGANLPRLAAAVAGGIPAAFTAASSGAPLQAAIRPSVSNKLFEGQRGQTNYIKLLRGYTETAGLFVVAGSVLKALLSADAVYAMQNLFFASSTGSVAVDALSRLNVFSPLFGAALQILARLLDFSALACCVMLFRTRYLLTVYAHCLAIALLLAVSLFFR